MQEDQLTYNWNTFEDDLLQSRKDLFLRKQFADVTLVSDDMVPFPAHRTVLSSSSKLLKSLFEVTDEPRQVLFLKGVSQIHLQSIIKFIYLGETSVRADQVTDFSTAVNVLGIEKLMNDSYSEPTTERKQGTKNLVEKLDFLSPWEETSNVKDNNVDCKNLEKDKNPSEASKEKNYTLEENTEIQTEIFENKISETKFSEKDVSSILKEEASLQLLHYPKNEDEEDKFQDKTENLDIPQGLIYGNCFNFSKSVAEKLANPGVINIKVGVENESLPSPQTEETTFVDIKTVFEEGTKESVKRDINKTFPIFDKCYHGSISTHQAEDRLRSVGMESCYLTRESDLQSGRFILSTISNGNIKHFIVPDCDGKNKKQASFIDAKSDIERLVLSSDDYSHPVPPPLLTSDGGTVRTGDTGRRQCQVCRKTLESQQYDLEIHYCNHFMKDLAAHFPQSVAALECELCGAKFTRKRNLLHHLGCRHGKINNVLKQKRLAELSAPQLTCFVCSEAHSDQKSMKNHLKIHRLKQCNHCKDFFICRVYEHHINSCKENPNKPLYQCQHCVYFTSRSTNLNKHMETNHQKPFSCMTCSKSFDDKEHLERHQQYHEASQYFCPHCGKNFKELKHLNYHVKNRHPK